MTTYRGQPVKYAVFDRKADTYSLIGDDEECLAELKAREFLSIPNRGNLEVRNGRYRSAASKDQRSANRKSGQARRDDPWLAFDPFATVTSTKQGPAPSLTLKAMSDMLALIQPPRMIMPASHWRSLQDVEAKPPLKREGIVAGEIVGYRCWRIEKGFLRSVYQGDVWKPGDVLEGRELGDWDQRGIHAWKNPSSKEYHDYIRSYLNRESDAFSRYMLFGSGPEAERPAMVTGTVFLWGDVVEHERGWRAEFARVRSLDWLYPDETMMVREAASLDSLRRRYVNPVSPAHRG